MAGYIPYKQPFKISPIIFFKTYFTIMNKYGKFGAIKRHTIKNILLLD